MAGAQASGWDARKGDPAADGGAAAAVDTGAAAVEPEAAAEDMRNRSNLIPCKTYVRE